MQDGAYVRAGCLAWRNPLFIALPLGTLAANVIGGYLIGVAVGLFTQATDLPPAFKLLFVITGFLGG